MEERRGANIEMLLVELGGMKALIESSSKKIDSLDIKVGIQNGRVGKLEKWQSYLYGIATILTLIIIPIALKYLPSILRLVISY